MADIGDVQGRLVVFSRDFSSETSHSQILTRHTCPCDWQLFFDRLATLSIHNSLTFPQLPNFSLQATFFCKSFPP